MCIQTYDISEQLAAFYIQSHFISMQDCSKASALVMQLLQSCTKPLIW